MIARSEKATASKGYAAGSKAGVCLADMANTVLTARAAGGELVLVSNDSVETARIVTRGLQTIARALHVQCSLAAFNQNGRVQNPGSLQQLHRLRGSICAKCSCITIQRTAIPY